MKQTGGDNLTPITFELVLLCHHFSKMLQVILYILLISSSNDGNNLWIDDSCLSSQQLPAHFSISLTVLKEFAKKILRLGEVVLTHIINFHFPSPEAFISAQH